MVYLTGDTHGERERFCRGKLRWLGKKNTVIVLGDFGFFWNDSKAERAARKWLQKRRYTVLFLDGCHENFELLKDYPEEQAFGGTVKHIGGNLYYVPRGQILTIEEQKLLCFGGGESTDKSDREEKVNWWPEELPTTNEMDACLQRLAKNNDTVDYILTHDAPERLMDFAGVAPEEISTLNAFFDKLLGTVHYKKWFFARYHRNLSVSPKARCLFTDVVPLIESDKK